MNNINDNIPSNKLNDDNLVITAPLIDKLSGVVDIQEGALWGLAFSNILGWLETHEPGIVQAAGSAKYPLAVKLIYTMNNNVPYLNAPHLLLQITGNKAVNKQIRFEYNPCYITETGEEFLNQRFFEMIGVTFYEFLAHARFTRVDVCRQIIDRNLEDYLIRVKWSKVSQSFFGANGALETINFGKSKGNQVVAYDKSKQLYGKSAEQPVIRIETRFRTKLTAQELFGYINPLERVKVYSVACKNPPFGIGHWRAFQDACRMRGIGNAIKMQPTNYRSALKKVLSKQPVPWWDIQPEDWKWLWGEALEKAGLLNIPKNPPPLTMKWLVGDAA